MIQDQWWSSLNVCAEDESLKDAIDAAYKRCGSFNLMGLITDVILAKGVERLNNY